MMVKFLLAFLMVLSLAACGGSTEKSDLLNGKWVSDENDGTRMVAIITSNHIQMTLDSEDLSSLYWKGTFPKSGKMATEGMTIISKADLEALAESITGSQAKSKTFTYTDGTLDFDFTVLGSTRVVHLKKE